MGPQARVIHCCPDGGLKFILFVARESNSMSRDLTRRLPRYPLNMCKYNTDYFHVLIFSDTSQFCTASSVHVENAWRSCEFR